MRKMIVAAAAAVILVLVGCDEGGPAPLTLGLPDSLAEGQIQACPVTLPENAEEDVEVMISSSNPFFLAAPASVTVPAGQRQASFDVTAVNNNYIDADTIVTITVSSPGYAQFSADCTVTDDEEHALDISFPTPIGEGSTNTGTVSLHENAQTRSEILVYLTSADPARVTVTDTSIPADGDSADFTITSIPDADTDPNNVIITAEAAGLESVFGTLTINDP